MTDDSSETPDDAPVYSGSVERVAATAARWVVTAARFTGRGVASAYKAVDPDVRRHVAQLPLLSYSLFSSRRQRLEAGESDGHPPLVFVHGLGGSRGDLLPMQKYLAWYGRKRSYRVQLEGGKALAELAEALAEALREVLAVTGEPRVEIVAHSLGGLVARLAIHDHGVAASVKTLITLGTPHRGTFSARFADTIALRELRPDSPLIERLKGERWPEQVHTVSFWSKSDMMILPPESAALEGADQLEVTPFTHYSYLIDPRSWVLVRKELEAANTR